MKVQNNIVLNSDLGGCQFGITDDGLPGWKEQGADTVIPFNHIQPNLLIEYNLAFDAANRTYEYISSSNKYEIIMVCIFYKTNYQGRLGKLSCVISGYYQNIYEHTYTVNAPSDSMSHLSVQIGFYKMTPGTKLSVYTKNGDYFPQMVVNVVKVS